MIVLYIFLGLLGLTLVVLAHELGHFIAAKLMGIDVLTFSIGWGKKLFSFRKGETEYCISMLPLGGYCRLKGEQSLIQAWEKNLTEIPKEKGAMFSASPWRRIIVSMAGPLFNLAFAISVFSVLYLIGFEIEYQEPRIILYTDLNPGADTNLPANKAGLETGDLILAVNGEHIERFDELEEKIAVSNGKKLILTVERGQSTLDIPITPVINKEKGTGIIGIYAMSDPVIDDIKRGSAASVSGLKAGDTITSVNGTAVNSTIGFMLQLSDEEERFEIGYIRDGIPGKAVLLLPSGSETGIGFRYLTTRTPEMGPVKALSQGTKETFHTLGLTVKSLKLLFSGIKLNNAVSGPIRITYITGQVASSIFTEGPGKGLVYYFQFLALISIALCFMNLLPIPALDGGQILLFIFEVFKRSPLTPKMIYRYQLIGTIAIFALIILATANDIFYLISH